MNLPTVDGTEVAPLLENLASLILPLEEWMKEADKFVPPENTESFDGLPWRRPGKSLSVKTLHLLESFAEMLSEAASGDKVVDRWNGIDANPFNAWTLPERPADWRKARNLPETARHFAPEASDNFEYAIDFGPHGVGEVVTRKKFYDLCFVELVSVFRLRQPVGPAEWGHVLDDLKEDKGKGVTGWDADRSKIKSPAFVSRFALDLATALFGPRPAASRLKGDWHFAMQIELGEHRRPGNHYSVKDARDGAELVRRKLAEIAAKSPQKP